MKEYQCSHCSSQVTTSGNGGLTPLTPKYQEINSVLSRIHKRRVARLTPSENSKPKPEQISEILDFTPHFS